DGFAGAEDAVEDHLAEPFVVVPADVFAGVGEDVVDGKGAVLPEPLACFEVPPFILAAAEGHEGEAENGEGQQDGADDFQERKAAAVEGGLLAENAFICGWGLHEINSELDLRRRWESSMM